MYKRLAILLLLTFTAFDTFAQSTAVKQLYRTIKDTYETKADSTTNAFIESFMIKEKGYFNVSYEHYAFNAYWTQAHAIDVVIYNYERHKNIDRVLANKYLNYIKLWYKNKANNYAGAAAKSTTSPSTSSDYKMFENPYTDDMCWITLTLLHIGEATGTAAYSIVARQVFDNYIIKRATEDEATGGLWLPWNTDAGSGPNACTQSPATLIAAKLYKKYGTPKYLEYAKKLYTYANKKMYKSDGRIEDPPLTYTQGTFGEACRLLYHITDESAAIKNKYKTQAYTVLNYAFTSGRCTNGSNILRDEGSSGDQSIFKAILIPYAVNYVLDEDMIATNRVNLSKLILKNTQMLWRQLDFSRYPLLFYNFGWTSPWTGSDNDASMGAACSGASLIENTARMYRAITDRYELGTLLTECNKFAAVPENAEAAAQPDFVSAMQKAGEILDDPSSFNTYQFQTAIEDLQEAYQAAQDFASGIASIQNSKLKPQDEDAAYSLTGQRVANKNLPRGIYIIGGRKVLVK